LDPVDEHPEIVKSNFVPGPQSMTETEPVAHLRYLVQSVGCRNQPESNGPHGAVVSVKQFPDGPPPIDRD